MSFFKHDTAIVDERVSIGDGTKIWHWTHICSGAKIGKNCVLGQNVYIGPNVVIGDDVKIQNNVSVYSGITIENDVFIGPSAVFTNVINPRASIERKHEFRSTLVKQGATVGANATIVCGNTLGAFCLVGAGAVITKNVSAHALVYGAPAEQKGWVSKKGITLSFQDKQATCPESGETYTLNQGEITPSKN